MRSAILFGATGLIGDSLLNLLLQNDNYSKVKIFNRKELKYKNPKLEIYKIDFDLIKDHASLISGNDCFFLYWYYKKTNTR